MEKFDLDEGHWVTVGGRKIFIRDGQSLSDAMKKSGKFKSAKKKTIVDDEKLKKESEKLDTKRAELWQKYAGDKKIDKEEYDKEYKKATDEYYKKTTDEDSESKYLEKRNKEAQFERETGKYTGERETNADGSYKHQVEMQQNDIEKASGLKVEKAWQTDKFGNGDADRFELSDGRIIEHSRESLGKKEDKWSVQTVEKGTINSKSYDSYDDMIKDLKGKSDNHEIKETSRVKEVREQNQKWRDSLNDTNYSQKELDNVYKNEDYSEIVSGLKNSELNKMKQAAHDMNTTTPGTPGYNYARDYLQKMENKAAAQFLDRQKSVESKVASHTAYKKAFEEYKKQHPNSKLTLQKFIDMSEGK